MSKENNLHWREKLWRWADEFQIPADKLPRKKADLEALTELDLNRKDSPLPKITYLPPEIGKLTQLQELDLSRNKLQTLPPEIGNLTQLRLLNLKANNLQTLPKSLLNLKKLTNLDIHKNKNLKLTSAQREFLKTIKHIRQ